MYVKHPHLTLNHPDTARLWRYMDFRKFERIVRNRALFFCRADRFHDPWEGVFPLKMIDKFELDQRRIPSSDGNTYTPCQWQMQKEARSHLINCWHANDTESFAMWKIYTDGPRPHIAVQSTIGRLKHSFDSNTDRIWIGEVEYIDFREWEPDNRFFNVGHPNTLRAFFTKWHYFRYEDEIRAVINRAYAKHGSEIGIPVLTNVDELVEAVYLSADTTQEEEQRVRTLLEENGCSFPVLKSDLGTSVYMKRGTGEARKNR